MAHLLSRRAMKPLSLRRALILTAVVAVGLASAAAIRSWRRTSPEPLGLSFWYWHRPFRLTAAERDQLRRAGVAELFVHAGTLYRRDDGTLGIALRQQWGAGSEGLPVHLVFNASGDVLRGLEELSPETLADTLDKATRAARKEAERAGARVIGLQCDLDYPSRLLPRYARMLATLRKRSPDLTLSASLLTTWYTRRELDSVLAQLDFSVPQFYEARTPRSLADFTPISDPKRLERGLDAAARRGHVFRAGLPAYGHALVFDGGGRLEGMYRDAGADMLAGDDRFRCEKAIDDPGSGERVLTFVAAGTDRPDHRVVFDLPTPASLRRCLDVLRERRPSNCAGAVLFRLPERGETTTVPLAASLSLWRGAAPAPRLRARIRTAAAEPWRAIEGGDAASRIVVDLINDGDAGSAVGPESVVLDVTLERPGVDDVDRGGFARAAPFAGEPGRATGRLRADGIRFTAALLPPGATLTAGPIRVPGHQIPRLTAAWRVLAPDGKFVLSGKEVSR